MGMWDQITTNKKVGILLPNDADGVAWASDKTGLQVPLKAAGYTVVQPGLHDATAEDFTAQIAEFKKAGCEISHRHRDAAAVHQLLEAVASSRASNPRSPGSERPCSSTRP